MFTAIAALILLVLILIAKDLNAIRNQAESVHKLWICRKCHGSGRARDADDPEERCDLCFGDGSAVGETNRWTAQILGKLDSIHNLILRLWACPTCSGSGHAPSIDFVEAPKECATCKGTGRARIGDR
jgi:rubrerythrin